MTDLVVVGERLRHVYWIGGGSGAGKSTIARRIAAQRGWYLYATDDLMTEHGARNTTEDHPFLSRFRDMDMDERWVSRSPQAMLETFHWFRGEYFSMIVDDLLALPKETGIIVEGFRLLPHLVRPLLAVPGHAVWLLPTSDFRQAAFDKRRLMSSGFISRTSDPEQTLRNLLERDRMFTDRLREETNRLGLRAIEVDTEMTEDDLAGRVINAFGY